jgi:ribosomal protein S1
MEISKADMQKLSIYYRDNVILKGILSKPGIHNYFVKNADPDMYIRLFVSENEINVKENYEYKIGTVIEYKIDFNSGGNKPTALLLNRTFHPGVYDLAQAKPVMAEVIGKVKGGFKVKVFDKIEGFIPYSLSSKIKEQLEDGEIISVTCIKASEDLDNFVFDLTENVERQNKIDNDRKNQAESLDKGDRIIGEITGITSNAIFISLGYVEGVIKIAYFVKNYRRPKNEEAKNQLENMLAKTFKVGDKIQVIVGKISEEKCKLNIDTSVLDNRELINETNYNYKTIAS